MINTHRISSQLTAAAEIWEQVKETPYPADRFLGNYFHRFRKKFGSRDRRFIAETIYALFRHKTFLEYCAREIGPHNDRFMVRLGAASEGFLTEEEWEADLALNFPGLKLPPKTYEMLRNRTIPSTGYDLKNALALKHSFPLWIVERWLQRYGEEETRQLLEASQKRPPFVIRANTIKIPVKKLIGQLHKKGWDVALTERSNTGILFKERANLFDSEEFREGLFEIQDEGSQILCEMVAPQPGEVVWDVCAGGGGKSLALAALMQNKGRIIATDIRAKKLEDLRERAARAGVNNIFPADLERMNEISVLKKGADKIVIDAPCSGTGTLRRNPDAKWKLKEEVFSANHAEELAILEKALPYLKPGGKLYYMTCSLEPEENENVMNEFLGRHPELKIVPYPRSKDGFFRLTPHHHQTDGFFLAIAEKTQ